MNKKNFLQITQKQEKYLCKVKYSISKNSAAMTVPEYVQQYSLRGVPSVVYGGTIPKVNVQTEKYCPIPINVQAAEDAGISQQKILTLFDIMVQKKYAEKLFLQTM